MPAHHMRLLLKLLAASLVLAHNMVSTGLGQLKAYLRRDIKFLIIERTYFMDAVIWPNATKKP